jgi:hypothetical protein
MASPTSLSAKNFEFGCPGSEAAVLRSRYARRHDGTGLTYSDFVTETKVMPILQTSMGNKQRVSEGKSLLFLPAYRSGPRTRSWHTGFSKNRIPIFLVDAVKTKFFCKKASGRGIQKPKKVSFKTWRGEKL